MDILPKDIIVEIANKLHISDVLNFSLTCKKFKKYVLENNNFWNRRSEKEYDKILNKEEYKKEYRKRIYDFSGENKIYDFSEEYRKRIYDFFGENKIYDFSEEYRKRIYSGEINYEISKEDKIEILDEICNFYDINVSLQYSYDTLNAVIIGKTYHVWDSLWGCTPPLSNIEYICKQIEKNFEGNPIDVLCIKMHNKYSCIFFP